MLPVTVIIVSYNTREYTLSALEALFASSQQPAEVILVDNASVDGTVSAVRAQYPGVVVIENAQNVGFAAANNQAIERSHQPYAWLLNSDTRTGKHTLEQLYTYMDQHPQVGALGPQLVYPDGSLQSVGGYFPTVKNVFGYLFPLTIILPKALRQRLHSIALLPQVIPAGGMPLDYVTGAAVLLRKKALDEVGLLPEEYFMYFEETDLCYRLARRGWQRLVIATEPVMHVYGGSYQTKYDAKRLNGFLTSLLLFTRKYYSGFSRFAILALVRVLGPVSIALKRLKNI